MSFDFEEWSATKHLLKDGDNLDKGAAAHFADSNEDDDDIPHNELEDDPEFFEGSPFLPKSSG